jgi:hypothetical protein
MPETIFIADGLTQPPVLTLEPTRPDHPVNREQEAAE